MPTPFVSRRVSFPPSNFLCSIEGLVGSSRVRVFFFRKLSLLGRGTVRWRQNCGVHCRFDRCAHHWRRERGRFQKGCRRACTAPPVSTVAREKLTRPYGWSTFQTSTPTVPTAENRPGATCTVLCLLFGWFTALLSLHTLNTLAYVLIAHAIRSVT